MCPPPVARASDNRVCGSESKVLILSECVNKTDEIGATWTNTNSYREKEALSDIFTRNILLHNRPNCFMFKFSITEIMTWPHKSVYLTTEIELVLPNFKSQTVHKIIEYLTLGLLSSLWSNYHSTTAYSFDPPYRGPCIFYLSKPDKYIKCAKTSKKNSDVFGVFTCGPVICWVYR